MRKAPSVFLFAVIYLSCLSGPASAATPVQPLAPPLAQPTEALFFPNEAQITVEEQLKPEALPGGGQGLIIAIPARADRSTFSMIADGAPAVGVYWPEWAEDESYGPDAASGAKPASGVAQVDRISAVTQKTTLPEREKDPERRELLSALIALQDEATRSEGAIKSIDSRLELWDAPPAAEKPLVAEERLKMDEAINRLLPTLYASRQKERRLLEDVQKRLNAAEEKLHKYDAAHSRQIAVLPLGATAAGAKFVRYTYVMPATCSTAYRIGADPAKESLSVEQEARLFQDSGFSWDNVEVIVSTAPRDKTLQPRPVNPWLLSFADAVRPVAASPMPAPAQKREILTSGDMNYAFGVLSEPPEPVQDEKASFRLWRLGKQRIENNAATRVPLIAETYKARFYYTLRPASNSRGFLTAEVALPQPLELPLGQARFMVDGVTVGTANFSFNGDKGLIYFGTDPQVTATVRDLKRTAGEQGFISKEQTILWHWRITLKNSRNRPVDLVVEDPAPNAADSAITLAVDAKPKPEEVINSPEFGGAKIYRWQITLKPGESQVIDYKVQAAAPADKQLLPGRGAR